MSDFIEMRVKLTPVKARLLAALIRCMDAQPGNTCLDIIDSAMYRAGYKSMDDWAESMTDERLAELLEEYHAV